MDAQRQDQALTMNVRSAQDLLLETRRRKEELIESLRRPSITQVIQPHPQQYQHRANEMEVDAPPEKRFEVNERFQSVDARLRRIEATILQNNIGGVDLETHNRAKKDLQRTKMQYIQTISRTEVVLNELIQENQYLRSKLINVEEENDHLKVVIINFF